MHMTVRQYSFNTLLLTACCFPLHVAVRQHSFNTLLLTLHHIYMDVQHHPVNALFYVMHDVNKVWTSFTRYPCTDYRASMVPRNYQM